MNGSAVTLAIGAIVLAVIAIANGGRKEEPVRCYTAEAPSGPS